MPPSTIFLQASYGDATFHHRRPHTPTLFFFDLYKSIIIIIIKRSRREKKLGLAGGRPSSYNQLSAWLCTTHTIIIKVDVPMSLKPQGNLYYDTIIIIINPTTG